MRSFKQASSRLAVDKDTNVHVLSLDAIIRVTEGALLFQHHPKLLMEIDPDLVRKLHALKLHPFACWILSASICNHQLLLQLG
jgi:hypothetical protein